jgi:hypothetical protein
MSKAANDNGSRRIMYLMEGMGSGLKILVSAVRSRPQQPHRESEDAPAAKVAKGRLEHVISAQ